MKKTDVKVIKEGEVFILFSFTSSYCLSLRLPVNTLLRVGFQQRSLHTSVWLISGILTIRNA